LEEFRQKKNVTLIFDHLWLELEKAKCDRSKEFNVDETDIIIVQHKPNTVVSMKDKKQVSDLTSAERGSLMTDPCHVYECVRNVHTATDCVSQERHEAIIIGWNPHATIQACHPSGWTHLHSFTQ
jgi:hypothetical protein